MSSFLFLRAVLTKVGLAFLAMIAVGLFVYATLRHCRRNWRRFRALGLLGGGVVATGRSILAIDASGRATRTACSLPAADGSRTETTDEGIWTDDGFALVAGKSTRAVVTRNAKGDAIRRERYAYVQNGAAGEWHLLSWETHQYNAAHKIIASTYSDRTTDAADWICTGPVYETGRDGITVTNVYDKAKQLVASTRQGPFGDMTTAYQRDAAGRIVREETSAEGCETQVVTRTYDTRGRIVSETESGGRTTTYAYSADDRIETVTYPDGGTRITTRNADGSLASITGTAVVPEYYTYDVAVLTIDGVRIPCRLTETRFGRADSPRFTRTSVNGFGETVREERSGFDGAVIVTENRYNAFGELVSSETTGEPVQTYEYDIWGDCIRSTESADGVARYIDEATSYVLRDDDVWRDRTRIVSSSDPTIAPVTNRTMRLASPWRTDGAEALVRYEETRSFDARGNESRTWSVFDPATSTRTTYRQRPECSNLAISEEVDGVVVTDISFSSVTNRVAYDAYRRERTRTDGRGNVTTLAYDEAGRLATVTDPIGATTGYGYDAMGRTTAVTNALGDVTVMTYDVRGNKTYEGGATYPVRYGYDIYGNRTSMTTYRNEALGAGDTTIWLVDEASGLVTQKVYADGNGSTYDYDANGRLVKRMWARGIETDYTYDGFGNLTRTDYSDETSSVVIAYDALGRKTSVTDVKGTTTYAYDAFGTLTNEATTGLYEKALTRHTDTFGRNAGYSVDGVRQTVLAYNPEDGRLISMQIPQSEDDQIDCSTSTSDFNSTSHSFTWTYLPGSDLKASLAIDTVATNRWSYEQQRDLLTQVRNEAHGSVVSQYDYTYDAARRRVSQTRSGSAMSETRTDVYGYNARGELVSAEDARLHCSTSTSNFDSSSTTTSNFSRYAYAYDDIGNRLTSVEPERSYTYTANNLNQYVEIGDLVGDATDPVGDAPGVPFLPQYDIDGNQTLIQTKIGIWSVAYNGENRPILWTCGTTNLVMSYDHMGRRVEYIETITDPVDATQCVTNKHQRFVYDNYLCIQRLDGTANTITDTFEWDPTEPIATRPLFWQDRRTPGHPCNFFYTHDGNKNVSEVISYSVANGVAAHYEYAPFGENTVDAVVLGPARFNPWRFSGEYVDFDLDVSQFCYRGYDATLARFLSRDPVGSSGGVNENCYCNNSPLDNNDVLGLSSKSLAEYELDQMSCTLFVKVRFSVLFIPGEKLSWLDDNARPDTRLENRWKNKAQHIVNEYFNGGFARQWNSQQRVNVCMSPCVNGCPKGVGVKFDLIFDEFASNKMIVIGRDMSEANRNSVDVNSGIAYIYLGALKKKSFWNDGKAYTQIQFVHEIGHALGLDHPGSFFRQYLAFDANSAEDYVGVEPESLMGMGMDLKQSDFRRAFCSHIKEATKVDR